MWKLKKVGNSILEQYANEMLSSLYDRIVNGRTVNGHPVCLTPYDISVLIPNQGTPQEDKSILKQLLILGPTESKKLNDTLMSQLIVGYDESEFPQYLREKNKRHATPLKTKYYSKLEAFKLLFNYDEQLSKNKSRSYWLTTVKGAEVCTYCNRQYTFTVTKVNTNGMDEFIARPELDHWLSKELYPLLSLNFYNLIPSCHTCNSSAKGNQLFNANDYVHPYLQHDDNPAITFSPTLAPIVGNHYGVRISRIAGSKEDNTIKAFALDEVYEPHGALEVEDLMNFNAAYSNRYISILFQQVLSNYCGSKSKAEVYRMLFGTELNPEDFGKRPLSKLKYDILKYLKVI